MSTSNTNVHAVLALVALLAACEASTRPDPGYGTDAGSDAAASGDGGRKDGAPPERDGGGDGGSDGGGDGGSDGGSDGDGGMECNAGCSGSTLCDRGTGECVECLRNADCDGNDQCRSDGRCVECKRNSDCESGEVCAPTGRCGTCTENADCTDATASFCQLDQGALPQCLSCEIDDHCDHIAGRPHCGVDGCAQCELATEGADCGGTTPRCNEDTGSCVECKPGTEALDCGAFSCDRTTFECTGVMRGTLLACQSCQSDTECSTNMACVEHVFQPLGANVSLGRFCFYKKGLVGCGNTEPSRRPHSQEVATTSVGGESTTFCLPITSCAAVTDALVAKVCSSSNNCGVADLADGDCLDIGGGDERCTYSCNNDFDCPETELMDCSSAPGKCIP